MLSLGQVPVCEPARRGVYLILWWRSFYKLPCPVIVLIKTITATFTLLDNLWTFFFFPQLRMWRMFVSADFQQHFKFFWKITIRPSCTLLDHANGFSTAFPYKLYFLTCYHTFFFSVSTYCLHFCVNGPRIKLMAIELTHSVNTVGGAFIIFWPISLCFCVCPFDLPWKYVFSGFDFILYCIGLTILLTDFHVDFNFCLLFIKIPLNLRSFFQRACNSPQTGLTHMHNKPIFSMWLHIRSRN